MWNRYRFYIVFLSLNTTLDSQLFDIDEIDISAKDIIKTPNREDTLVQLIPDEGGSKTFLYISNLIHIN